MTFYERAKELVSKMTIEEKMAQMRYDAPAIERLGVPAYNWWNECLHGVARQGSATVFPQAIGMAASFNEGLMLKVATAISDTEGNCVEGGYKTCTVCSHVEPVGSAGQGHEWAQIPTIKVEPQCGVVDGEMVYVDG